ncbi:hypothetical protein [Phenylobacterium sp.]|uniref:hypothetical protein n=1 Tax=Phenylobacterium sp. TaxID=1871053 RepID=UPI0035620EAD
MSEAPQTAVNPQIVDAVQLSTEYALGFGALNTQDADPSTAVSAGAAIAYDKAVQAAALAVQDAADYQRNVLAISTAVQGKAMALILANPAAVDPDSGPVWAFGMAVLSSLVAPVTAGLASLAITEAVTKFPRA